MPDSFSAIRETTSGWRGAYSRFMVAGATDALLRRVEKFTPPSAYRMRVRFPNTPGQDPERASQRGGGATFNLTFLGFNQPFVEPRAEFLHILRSSDPEQNQLQPVDNNREREDKEGQRQKAYEQRPH